MGLSYSIGFSGVIIHFYLFEIIDGLIRMFNENMNLSILL